MYKHAGSCIRETFFIHESKLRKFDRISLIPLNFPLKSGDVVIKFKVTHFYGNDGALSHPFSRERRGWGMSAKTRVSPYSLCCLFIHAIYVMGQPQITDSTNSRSHRFGLYANQSSKPRPTHTPGLFSYSDGSTPKRSRKHFVK